MGDDDDAFDSWRVKKEDGAPLVPLQRRAQRKVVAEKVNDSGALISKNNAAWLGGERRRV